MSEPILKPNRKILFIGDSITDCGRRNEPPLGPYGRGYMPMVRDMLIASRPELGLTFENRGIGGNTIRDLKARWEEDVIAEAPDALSIMIGINDVWRQVQNRPAAAELLDEYEATYRELLDRTREEVNPVFLLATPYIIETDRNDPFRARMDEYGACVKRLADEYGATLVDTQAAFDKALEGQPSAFWAQDRVHPISCGHAVLALAFLKTMGFVA